jgi:hypothetical protein
VESGDTCVYAHYRKSDGLMFYIGIGSKWRPYSTESRNQHWTNVVAKHGYTIEVLLSDLTWEEACAVEIEMIAGFRSEVGQQWAKLTNQTDGGEGAKGWSKDPRNAKWLEKLRRLCESPEWRAKTAEASKAAQSPEWRANVITANRNKTPEQHANQARANRKLAQCPEWRRKNAEAARNRSSEWRSKNAEAMRKRADDPSYREAMRKLAETPEWRTRFQVSMAVRYASAPHTRLNPYHYSWLYVHSDGKVYAC